MHSRKVTNLESAGSLLRCKAYACHVRRPMRPSPLWLGKHDRHRRAKHHNCQARLGDDKRHVLFAPGPPDDKQQLASVLLMLLPGAYMSCEAYEGLLTRLKVIHATFTLLQDTKEPVISAGLVSPTMIQRTTPLIM